ncbi:MAG: Uma2 family endonuclease [Chloroflexota bacterium]|nr:MAG: Uma2 family endonuclease [Chloroflexota bacterium]
MNRVISIPAGKVTYDKFQNWYDEIHAEWVNDKIVIPEPPTIEHQSLRSFLGIIISMYCEHFECGHVFFSPFQMYLEKQKCGREPDIFFVASKNLERIKQNYLDGPADLVIEIISPESVGRDRGEKFVEYEAAGIREYWLIDPQRKQAEFYRLDDEHRYQLITSGREGIFYSQVIEGFYFKIEWLWQKPLPKVMPILKEMGIA